PSPRGGIPLCAGNLQYPAGLSSFKPLRLGAGFLWKSETQCKSSLTGVSNPFASGRDSSDEHGDADEHPDREFQTPSPPGGIPLFCPDGDIGNPPLLFLPPPPPGGIPPLLYPTQ